MVFFLYTQRMLLVRTKVGPSMIHGLGLFADEFIPQGKRLWTLLPGFDQRFTRDQVVAFPEIVQMYLANFASFRRESNLYLLCGDSCNYMNHSLTPNCRSERDEHESEMPMYALRDIKPGEELTEDYSDYEDDNDERNVLKTIADNYHLLDIRDPRLE